MQFHQCKKLSWDKQIATLYLNFNTETSWQSKYKAQQSYQTSYCEVCRIRNIHKICKVKSISQTWVDWIKMLELIARAWQNPSWKSQFQNSVNTMKQNAMWNPTRCPKNLPCCYFEDERYTHWNPFQTAWWPVCNPFDGHSFHLF